MAWTIHQGDCREVMAKLDAESVDAVICDPPYGLEFMGKEWDSFRGEAWRSGAGMSKPGIGDRPTAWPSFGGGDSANATCASCGGRMRGKKKCRCEHPDWRVKGKPLGQRNARAESMQSFGTWCEAWAAEALRVAKPGAHLLAFGGTRTYHRLACAIEDAGWEIRDCVMWVYGSGFPKSHNVSKAVEKMGGNGYALLPDEQRFCDWMRVESGLDAATVKRLVGSDRFITGEVEIVNTATTDNPRWGRRAMVPTDAAWKKLRAAMVVEPPDWVEAVVKEPPGPAITHPGEWKAGKGQGTVGTNDWAGWGTALKPSHEPVIVARKPLPEDAERATIVENLSRLESQLCLLMSDAWLAEASLMSSRAVERLLAIARWTAGDRTNTRAALCGQMDTSQCELAIRFSLNTVRSWKSIWEDGSVPTSTFITATGSSTTIGWQTLKSCVSDLTLPCIIQAASEHGGSWHDAVPAAAIFNAVSVSTSSIRTLSAHASAIEQGLTPRPDAIDRQRLHRPIIVARKPLCGTVAENVLRHGTGAINVDGCRVGDTVETWPKSRSYAPGQIQPGHRGATQTTGEAPAGRWPANVIHDGSDEVVNLFPQAKGMATQNSSPLHVYTGNSLNHSTTTFPPVREGYNDSGSAARFFYCAKASKADRDEGCDGLAEREAADFDHRPSGDFAERMNRDRPDVIRRNHHPTVKPTALMRYLCRLVTPPGGVVLDPFTGSGSTGKAAVLEGFDFVGIEREAEYVEIAKARIGAADGGAGPLFSKKVEAS